ncbi:transglutaminase domain-containing protein [Candidatus Woesearchaeota archaeon]|nr:transglutaminase domain-containing protein [Candidatus Woesearchaeota archaeon]
MKRLTLFLIFLITIPYVFADWFYHSQNIFTNIRINGDAEIVPSTPSGYVQEATINMTFIPKNTDVQEITKLQTNPLADFTGDSLKFKFQKPEGKIDFNVNADVKTINFMPEIGQKIGFPIKELPKDIAIYAKPSETIDADNESIVRIASELVKGEDDLYSAVFKIADWTKNNINYNLSTLTAEVSQKASWVLENRQGVCDELTSLFIALLRAVGIPARFISGISYTESELFPDNWGAHGWAEVYFPGYGWVPFDVTYGEYGWVDPTHVKFKESVDSDEPSTYYSWIGRNADLKTGKLDIKTNLIDKVGYYRVPINLDSSVLKKSISFGSYNLLTASIENLNDFYYATELRLSKPKEVKIIGSEHKSILLLPLEKKEVFWILKLDEDFDSGYSYTFPLLISTTNNITSETSFSASIREQDVSFEEIEQITKLMEEEKEKKYSGNVVLDCKASKDEFYEYEDAEIYCDAKNIGNVFLEDADVCFEGECKNLDLGIGQAKNATFGINKSNTGLREVPVTLRNELVSKAFYVSFKVNDEPRIEVEGLEFPINVSYDDKFDVLFTLTKKSQSSPKNVGIVFSQNGFEKKWTINELTENRKFIVNVLGKQLGYGNNKYTININYFDGLNKQYNANKEFSVNLTDITLTQRVLLWFNNLENASLRTIVIMIGVVFIVLIGWLFRRGK